MSIPIIDTLKPLGEFPVANGKDVSVEGKSLDKIVDDYEDRISALEAGGGGGGEGTTNYNALENKPEIEGVELRGNKTASELGLAKKSEVPTKTSQLTNDAGFSTFSGDYDELTHKPAIPTKTSELTNDSGFSSFSGNYNDLTNKPTIPTTKSDIGLDAVDNTSDVSKPLSAAALLEFSRINSLNTEFNNRITALEDSGGGGGGGETTNYNVLVNKPSINGIELRNNKTAADLGLSTFSGNYADLENKPTIATKTSQLTNDAGFTTFSGNYADLENKPTIPTRTSQLLNDSEFSTFSGKYSDLTGKPAIPATKADIGLGNVDNTSDANKPVSTAVRTEINRIDGVNEDFEDRISALEAGGGGGGTTDYNALSNKPSIGGVELKGNKTASALGLASASSIPTKLSQLTNDAGYSKFSGDYSDLTGKPAIPATKADIGLGNVDNTADLDKPVSAAVQTALSGKASTTSVSSVTESVTNVRNSVNTLSARMDTFASLPAGSTSGNAELLDIRVGQDGKTYDTAGNAVRQQIADSKNILRQLMPEYASSRWRNNFSPNYRVQAWCYDKITGRYFIIGNAISKNGNALLTVTTDIRNFSDARQYVVKTGHSNDITYNYDNQKLYVTCGNAPTDGGAEGDVPNNAIAEIETTNFTLVKYYTLDVDVTCRVEYIGDNKFVAGDFTYGSIYNSNFSQKLSSNIFKWGEGFYIDPIYGISADSTASQSCCTDGDYLYVIYAGSIHDQSTGLAWNDGYFVVKFGMDGRFVDYNFASFKRPGAEAEGCFIKDNKIYVCTDGNFADFTWANLHGGRYETPEGLLANDDLNDFLRPGTYFANTADKSKTIVNNPGVTYAGFTVTVEVNDNKGVVQKLIPANTVALEYRRVFYNGTWGEWYLFGAKPWTLSNNAYVVSGHIYPSTDSAGGTVLMRCTLPFCFKSLNLTRIRGILRGVNGNLGDFDLNNVNIDVNTSLKTVTVNSNVYIKIVRNPGDFINIEYWFKSAPDNYVEYTPVAVQLNLTGTAIGNQ